MKPDFDAMSKSDLRAYVLGLTGTINEAKILQICRSLKEPTIKMQ